MKKLVFTALAVFALSAQAADYPASCSEMIDLTYEAAEVMPEMKEQLGVSKEEMTKVSHEAWGKMSAEEQAQAEAGCKAGIEQMKSIIEAAKAAKK